MQAAIVRRALLKAALGAAAALTCSGRSTAAASFSQWVENFRLRARARELAVEWRDINGLVPYARNARTHSEAQIAQIAGSIREFGFTNPVLIDPEGGIIAGHGPGCGAGFGSRTGCATFPRHGPAAGGEALA